MSGATPQFGHKELIVRMLVLYNGAKNYSYAVTRWPDEEERDRRACDAWAVAPNAVPLAIEHTKIETFTNRKLDDARFMKVVAPLEAELKTRFPYRLSLIVPTFAIQPKTDWKLILARLRDWLLNGADSLPAGRSKQSVQGVPFQIIVDKRSDAPNLFTVGRMTPESLDDAELVAKWRSALVSKDDQLRRYHLIGAQTILLAESDDMALVSLPLLYKAFLCARSNLTAPSVDQVWMAHAYAPEDWCEIVCFLGPDEIMDRVNPENYGFGPRFHDAWFDAMREEGFRGIS